METLFIVIVVALVVLFSGSYYLEWKIYSDIIKTLLRNNEVTNNTKPVQMSEDDIKAFKEADVSNTSEFLNAIAGLNEFMTGFKEVNNVEEQ